MKVLVVDDDMICQRVLQLSLESLGHQVVMAKNGREALGIFQDTDIQMVISDWRMPEMDGMELSQAVRSIRKAGYVYFILVSSTRPKADRYAEAVSMGIDDFLMKPFDHDEISNRLRVAERIMQFTTEIRQLKSLLPICMYCRKIRDDGNYWQQIESYIREATGSNFSHGICPDCYEKVVKPELAQLAAEPPQD
ncbi:MAG: response regulator [Verrucomicrobium sp.]|nr:response regulator [Verrucomicrobium sp.]